MNGFASSLPEYCLSMQYCRIDSIVNIKCGQRPLFSQRRAVERLFSCKIKRLTTPRVAANAHVNGACYLLIRGRRPLYHTVNVP